MNSPSSTKYDAGGAYGQYSVREFLTIVFKRRALILFTLCIVVALVMLIAMQMPKLYRVTATLLVNEARAEMPIAPTESGQLIVNRVSEEDLNSEIEVLKSRNLVENVVRRLSAEEPLNPESSSYGPGRSISAISPDDDAKQQRDFNMVVSGLRKRLEISRIRKSNILRLSYQSKDPEWATRVVATLTEEYLSQRADRYQSPQAVLFFEQQMKDAERRLTENKQALEDFVDEASITMVEGSDGTDTLAVQKQMVMQRQADLESSLGEAEVVLDSKIRQVASLQAMLRSEPERLESSSLSHKDTTTSEIERALAVLELERDRLLQEFKPDSRHVRDIDAQIARAKGRLEDATETSKVSGTESNPVYVELKGELLRAEASLEGTRAQVTSLRAKVVEYRDRKELDSLNAKAFDLEALRRNAQTAEEDYLLYRKKHEEARISAAMDQENFINVTVAQPAQIPLRTEPRGLALKLVLSVVLGLLGGIVLAFGVERYVDGSFTTAEDLEKRLGISHIASIPDGEMVG